MLFSLGAMIGATITMYAAVSNRMREIGVLRALGFRRSMILGAFLFEAVVLGVIGWAGGLSFASLMTFVKISTLNWTSLSELAIRFVLTPEIIWKSFIFALIMGFLGGFLPALRASRMEVVNALRVS